MKTLIIGLDGADWQIIEPLLNAGQLPTLKKLIDTGCRGILRSTIPAHSPPAWASMITGVNPGKHGIFDFTVIDDYQRVTFPFMSKLSAPPLWRMLNEHGTSTGIFNLPILFPPEPVQGYMVCGGFTPGDAKVFTYPERLSQVIGNPAKNWNIGSPLFWGGHLEPFLSDTKEKTKRHAELVLQLVDEFSTSFLMAVFAAPDRLQHFLWKYWDTTHPNHDPQASEVVKSAISSCYRDLDANIGKIIERFGEGNVFVVSDHGFRGVSRGLYMEQWLLDKGYLYLRPPIANASNRMVGDSTRRVWDSAKRLTSLKNLVRSSPTLTQFVRRMNRSLYQRGTRSSDFIDWSKTRVFYAGIGLQINLKGREKFGIVAEGKEYSDLVDELKAELRRVSDPQTHCPPVRYAYHRDEIYKGPKVADAPDLILVDDSSCSYQEGFPGHLWGLKHVSGMERSGEHRREGIFIASGPDLRTIATQIEVDILDITPTILYLNHVPIPQYMDGAIMNSTIKQTCLDTNPVMHTEQYEPTVPQSDGYTAEERASVEEHLKALGYL